MITCPRHYEYSTAEKRGVEIEATMHYDSLHIPYLPIFDAVSIDPGLVSGLKEGVAIRKAKSGTKNG